MGRERDRKRVCDGNMRINDVIILFVVKMPKM